jgi:hypothetical protein
MSTGWTVERENFDLGFSVRYGKSLWQEITTPSEIEIYTVIPVIFLPSVRSQCGELLSPISAFGLLREAKN